MVSIDLGATFFNIHGYYTGAFEPEFDKVYGNVPGMRKETGEAGNAPLYGYDQTLKREYYLPITMSYSLPNEEAIQEFDLPFPVISGGAKKTIVQTELTEQQGTVSQLINLGTVKFTVRGMMISDTNEFPEQLMTKLVRLYEQKTAIQMQNAFSDIFFVRPGNQGSDNVVITDLNFPEVRGVKNHRGYELTLISDRPFSLKKVR